MNPVPVLMYHHVAPHPGDTVTVRPETFALQMELLARHGYRTLSADEVIGHITGELPVDGKAVAITFDDGWLDNYIYAYPVLERHRMQATFFLVTGRTSSASSNRQWVCDTPPTHEEAKAHIAAGRAGRVVLDWDTVRTMLTSGLVSFYSHTVSHLRCDGLEPVVLLHELKDSKAVIQNELGGECCCLCWPYGSFSDHTISIAEKVGYRAMFTTIDGFCNSGTDPLRIPRVDVQDSLQWLEQLLDKL